MSDEQTTIPADEILLAIELIVNDRGEGGFLDLMPVARALWERNRARAEWLSELDRASLPEPPLVR